MTITATTKYFKNWSVILYMIFLHIGALFAIFPSNFSWSAVILALFLHWVTGGLGITLGWHRLATHHSFQVPRWLEYFLVFCGTLACQGGVINWVGMHRIHHLHSDQKLDPHNSTVGFWWSHMDWMLHKAPADKDLPRFTKDIQNDLVYSFFDKYFIPIQIVFGLIVYILFGWPSVIWGIFVRIVVVFHCTWLTNSATHKFGYRSYETSDRSKNCWWVALLTYGEGWHNNHHAYPYSARHGMRWWEIDLTWLSIKLLKTLGLASKIKLVGNE
jgi:sn-1 stearoyl-lipid 9-desaturase